MLDVPTSSAIRAINMIVGRTVLPEQRLSRGGAVEWLQELSVPEICGVSDQHIVEEYRLSIGADSPEPIRLALAGMRDLETYFKGVDLDRVRAVLTG